VIPVPLCKRQNQTKSKLKKGVSYEKHVLEKKSIMLSRIEINQQAHDVRMVNGRLNPDENGHGERLE
jgi:hypothetical protein